MLISIPMAVYNGKEFLDRSIKSILSQTADNWELICVDDGSTDESAEIIERYASQDQRIKLIRQKNMGHPTARMVAYRVAKGSYIFTGVDQDDFVAPDFVAQLSADVTLSKAEVVLCDWLTQSEDGNFVSFFQRHGRFVGERLSGNDAFAATFPWTIHLIGAWSQRLVEEFATKEENAYNTYDADEFLARKIVLNTSDVYLGAAKYYHCNNLQSVTSRPTPRKLQALDTNNRLIELAREYKQPENIVESILLFQRNQIANAFVLVAEILGSEAPSVTQRKLIAEVRDEFENLCVELKESTRGKFKPTVSAKIIVMKLRIRYWNMLIKVKFSNINHIWF